MLAREPIIQAITLYMAFIYGVFYCESPALVMRTYKFLLYYFLSVSYDYHDYIHEYLSRKHRDSRTKLPSARDWYHLRVAGEFKADG